MTSDRRAFLGKVFGGALMALGVKAAPLLLAGNRHEMARPSADDWASGVTTLKRGDVLTFEMESK